MGDFSVTSAYDKVKTNGLDFLNKLRYNQQADQAATANTNWTPAMQNNLMSALNGQGTTSDAASGRMNP